MRRRAAGSRVTGTRRPTDRSRRVRGMSKPLKEVFVPHLNRTVKFGRKRPVAVGPHFRLCNFLRAALPAPPPGAPTAGAASYSDEVPLGRRLESSTRLGSAAAWRAASHAGGRSRRQSQVRCCVARCAARRPGEKNYGETRTRAPVPRALVPCSHGTGSVEADGRRARGVQHMVFCICVTGLFSLAADLCSFHLEQVNLVRYLLVLEVVTWT